MFFFQFFFVSQIYKSLILSVLTKVMRHARVYMYNDGTLKRVVWYFEEGWCGTLKRVWFFEEYICITIFIILSRV